MDHLTKAQRSQNMAAVRGKNTKLEMSVRSIIHRSGFRFSLHRNNLPGKPDLVLPKYKSVIFVHGCFWHGHDCSRGKRPSTQKRFWNEKLDKNIERDKKNIYTLEERGWRVFIIWECEWKTATNTIIKKLSAER